MAAADPISMPAATRPAAIPLATIHAYCKTGEAIVTVERAGRAPRRHSVSFRRYAALLEWSITRAARRWRTSDWWGRSSIAVSLWEAREARA